MKKIDLLKMAVVIAIATVAIQTRAIENGSVTELKKIDLKIGTGELIAVSKLAQVHYTGWLYSETSTGHKGKQFDSSYTSSWTNGGPLEFLFGVGTVISGWDQGMIGMKVGGKRNLIIPADLAYGSAGVQNEDGTDVIPPNMPLVFDVELMEVHDIP